MSAPASTVIAHYHEPEATASAAVGRQLMFSWLGEPQLGLRTRQTMQAEITGAGFEVVEDAGLIEQAARVHARAPSQMRLQVSRITIARAAR
jgi:hypothetical protein